MCWQLSPVRQVAWEKLVYMNCLQSNFSLFVKYYILRLVWFIGLVDLELDFLLGLWLVIIFLSTSNPLILLYVIIYLISFVDV